MALLMVFTHAIVMACARAFVRLQMLEIIRSNESANHWPTLEATLFVMSSVARDVDVYVYSEHYSTAVVQLYKRFFHSVFKNVLTFVFFL